ncbi:MAG: hypothetical protein GXP38_01175 [Chloroflexi bacterium]|nr:hypothetical protein [Chloroflexota bacterium]
MMSDYRSYLSVTVWTTLLILALEELVSLPERMVSLTVLGSPVRLGVSAQMFVGLVAVTVVCAGFEAAIHTHPRKDLLKHTYRFWGLPGATVMTATVTLAEMQGKSAWLLAMMVTAVVLIAILWGEYHVIDTEAPVYRRARVVLNAMALLLVAVAFVYVYQSRMRSLVSAPLMGGIAGLVALDLLREATPKMRTVQLYAGVIAFLMAQATWLLNYSALPALPVGLFLLTTFYFLVSLAMQELRGQLRLRRGLEYLALTLIVLVAVILKVWQ